MSYYICGLDEVGRGALAGPMLAVAAMFYVPKQQEWSSGCPIPGVKDSKQFSNEKNREQIFTDVLRCVELFDFGIGESSVEEINEKGIDYANRMVFYRAVQELKRPPDHVLVDGNMPVPVLERHKQTWKPKADALWWPVGAASILAKVIRDKLMTEIHQEFVSYDIANNAGYGAPKHLAALRNHGAIAGIHRTKFVSKYVSHQ